MNTIGDIKTEFLSELLHATHDLPRQPLLDERLGEVGS